jgi:hypothetical protein
MVEALRIHRLSMAAALVGVGVAIGYMLAGVPNVEGISAVSFFAGYRLGAGPGALVGGLAIGIFSALNPLGPPLPQVLIAQIIGMGLIGAAGRIWRLLVLAPGDGRIPKIPGGGWFGVGIRRAEVLAAAMGAVLTLVYGVLADYGFAVSIGRWKDPLPVIAVGLPFSVVHVVSNCLIFGGLSAFLVRGRTTLGGE